MGFYNKLIKTFKREKRSSNSVLDDLLNPSFDSVSTSATYSSAKALNLSAVWRAVNIISDAIASIDINIMQKDADNHKKRMPKHPAYGIVGQIPNSNYSKYDLIKMMVSSMLLTGDGYCYIQRSQKDGSVENLWFVESAKVTINASDYGVNKPIEYLVEGLGKVESDNLIRIRNFTKDGINSLSTIAVARESLAHAYELEQESADALANGNIKGVLSSTTPLTAQQKKQNLKAIKEYAKNGGFLIAEGNFNYSNVQQSLADMEYLSSRKFSMVEIANWFNLPLSKLNYPDKQSYNNLEEESRAFWSDCISPIVRKFELEFLKIFLPSEKKKGYCVIFDKNSFLQGNMQTQASYYSTLFSCASLTPNEIRSLIDLPHIEGGDNLYAQINLGRLNNEGLLETAQSNQNQLQGMEENNPLPNEENNNDKQMLTENNG